MEVEEGAATYKWVCKAFQTSLPSMKEGPEVRIREGTEGGACEV